MGNLILDFCLKDDEILGGLLFPFSNFMFNKTHIKLKSKEMHCANLELKATEDSKHIGHLGNIIDKLRADIAHLETIVNNVKNTQQKVRWLKWNGNWHIHILHFSQGGI